ncbi:tripartite ATP-independent transporter solute receptor, DctP family [Alteribacillus persepolensis]|uniref:Tripartite ATP-independent transporter solute receptor, DctP family n=1 Tax=Alteribacillus persepolensis TaxID=568899 RepID=A0A1G8J859_9BACI|nr:TRAP transporter substrate-binding protein [Alteribacillus persepolensis]SDI27439.1 tripartite ATP-independent transporter solute receptor, DctP family [Alteribacillus persepolensis]
MNFLQKYWKRFTIAMGMAVLLTACGNGGETTDSGADPQSGEGESGTAEGAVQAEHEFKLGLITPPAHMWHQAAEKFKEELETNSDGRMTLDIYPSGQLGNESDMLQQIESGSIDFGFITAAEISSREDVFSAWFTPYLFETIEDAHQAREADIAQEMLGTLEQYGMTGLDYLFAGQRVMLFKDKKVQQPEDMEGLVLRVTPSPPMLEFYNSTGASTEGIPLPEVYSAVQTGVIDGMDMDLDATITNKFFEVVDYGAVTNHMVWPSVAVVNTDTFSSLPEEDQQIIEQSLESAADYAVETRSAQEEEFKQTLTDEGMEIYELDKSVFEEQIESFDEKYKEKDPMMEEFITTFRQ